VDITPVPCPAVNIISLYKRSTSTRPTMLCNTVSVGPLDGREAAILPLTLSCEMLLLMIMMMMMMILHYVICLSFTAHESLLTFYHSFNTIHYIAADMSTSCCQYKKLSYRRETARHHYHVLLVITIDTLCTMHKAR